MLTAFGPEATSFAIIQKQKRNANQEQTGKIKNNAAVEFVPDVFANPCSPSGCYSI
jgi:hypothetical protein